MAMGKMTRFKKNKKVQKVQIVKKKKKNKRQRATSLFNRGPSVVPDRYFTTLKYREIGNFNAVSTQVLFRGNSIFDPEEALGGGQPMGFDQLAPLYNKYKIHASSITISVVNRFTSNIPYTLTIAPSDTTTIAGRLALMEFPYAKWKLIPTLTSSPLTMSSKILTKALLGYSTIANEESVGALVSQNPAEQWFWHIDITSSDGLSAPNVDMVVSLNYQVEFYDRKDLPRS